LLQTAVVITMQHKTQQKLTKQMQDHKSVNHTGICYHN